MCSTDSTPDPKHTNPTGLSKDSATPIRAAQVLVPYPERANNRRGVRQHTAPTAIHGQKSANRLANRGRRRPFGASVLLTVTAQAVLAAAIASQRVSPIIGATAAVGLLVAGLALVVAEMLQVARR